LFWGESLAKTGRVVMTEELSTCVMKAKDGISFLTTASASVESCTGEGEEVVWQVLARAVDGFEEVGKWRGKRYWRQSAGKEEDEDSKAHAIAECTLQHYLRRT
jgi:hypothetical protein